MWIYQPTEIDISELRFFLFFPMKGCSKCFVLVHHNSQQEDVCKFWNVGLCRWILHQENEPLPSTQWPRCTENAGGNVIRKVVKDTKGELFDCQARFCEGMPYNKDWLSCKQIGANAFRKWLRSSVINWAANVNTSERKLLSNGKNAAGRILFSRMQMLRWR